MRGGRTTQSTTRHPGDDMTTDPTPAIEVWARMLCAADVHVYGDEHPTWQQLGRLSGKLQDDYRKAARWLLPRLTAGQPAPVDRGTIVREAISHLRNVNISCTALTGPIWYGTGWNEAISQLEEVADQMSDEGQPKRELITVDAFARALHDAQVWFHKGDFPAWDELSTAPGRGQDEVRMVARWLLKRLFVAERAAKEADEAQQTSPARLLDCGLCYEENGEEIHPHPACTAERLAVLEAEHQRWEGVRDIVERAIDKGWSSIDTYQVEDALGPEMADEAQQAGPPAEVVHGCPPDGSGLTPCCGRTPFELPLGHRISTEAPTTCTGPAEEQRP
jgi:hypothetical protein